MLHFESAGVKPLMSRAIRLEIHDNGVCKHSELSMRKEVRNRLGRQEMGVSLQRGLLLQ